MSLINFSKINVYGLALSFVLNPCEDVTTISAQLYNILYQNNLVDYAGDCFENLIDLNIYGLNKIIEIKALVRIQNSYDFDIVISKKDFSLIGLEFAINDKYSILNNHF